MVSLRLRAALAFVAVRHTGGCATPCSDIFGFVFWVPPAAMREAAMAVKALAHVPESQATAVDLLVDGFAALHLGDWDAAAPLLARDSAIARGEPAPREGLGGFGVAARGAPWRRVPGATSKGCHELMYREIESLRDIGALTSLPYNLDYTAILEVYRGRFDRAERIWPRHAKCFRPSAPRTSRGQLRCDGTARSPRTRGAGPRGSGSPQPGISCPRPEHGGEPGPGVAVRTGSRPGRLPGRVRRRAAGLCGRSAVYRHQGDAGSGGGGEPDRRADAARTGLDAPAGAGPRERHALGARAAGPRRALLPNDVDAERLYAEALTLLTRAGATVDLARAHLVYGGGCAASAAGATLAAS